MQYKGNRAGRSASVLALALTASMLAGCGGGSGGSGAVAQPSPQPGPARPSPAADSLAAEIAAAAAAIRADGCTSSAACNWTERHYRPEEFLMQNGNSEALLVIDNFPNLPVRAIRYRKRIKAYYRAVPGGIGVASGTWRVPTVLWDALDRFTTPVQIAAYRLREVSQAARTRYDGLPLDNAGHGSYVFSLLADANPEQALVVMDELNLHVMNRADFCDTSGNPEAQARLLRTASQAAEQLKDIIRTQNVRFINYSAGHSLPQLAQAWPGSCGNPAPAEPVLRAKLAAYAPLYAVLFGTSGVMAAHASTEAGHPADFPYDQISPDYRNRMRIGYFTSLASGLDAEGRGQHAGLNAWPSAGNADIYVNTGVLPQRPYEFNRTPLLQIDQFGLDVIPITGPQPSWVAPLAVSRMISLRYGSFGKRQMDDALVADILAATTPVKCSDQPQQRCRFQDPLLHGQIEAVRLGYRPREYTQ